jgi:hypothetical protein
VQLSPAYACAKCSLPFSWNSSPSSPPIHAAAPSQNPLDTYGAMSGYFIAQSETVEVLYIRGASKPPPLNMYNESMTVSFFTVTTISSCTSFTSPGSWHFARPGRLRAEMLERDFCPDENKLQTTERLGHLRRHGPAVEALLHTNPAQARKVCHIFQLQDVGRYRRYLELPSRDAREGNHGCFLHPLARKMPGARGCI